MPRSPCVAALLAVCAPVATSFQWITTPTREPLERLYERAREGTRVLPPADVIRGLASEGIVYATGGNGGYIDFVSNAAVSVSRLRPSPVPLVAMLDPAGYRQCEADLKETLRGKVLCASVNCASATCGGSDSLSEKDFRSRGCMTELGVCFNRIKLDILTSGVHLLWVDADAALARPVQPFLRGLRDIAIASGCDKCTGTCATDPAGHLEYIDLGARLPPAHYKQVNTGLTWYNGSNAPLILGLIQTGRIIQSRRLRFKSVDQTVLNRRLMALGGRQHCMRSWASGLNRLTKRDGVRLHKKAWGAHAARLVSRHGFYKRAYLYLHGLWFVPQPYKGFADDARRWQRAPEQFVAMCERMGETAVCFPHP
eukprot:TRINITY_DN30311_c0_g1_i1.p1 TRINITY_DN30311_c0_g1~~TRINITY_DN30311_c0_g1_i1.p1  ORF type:complete len:369 (+),score=86.47 TRINITY_DN30311_c0_g1_i1:51-1157(+)